MNNTEKIFSDDPEFDVWMELKQFAYEANIMNWFEKRGFSFNDSISNTIIGSVLQADEYFKLASLAELQVSPLLLYYGCTNLFYAIAILLTGAVPDIKSHGMKTTIPDEMNYIADVLINFNDKNNGGVHLISECLGLENHFANRTNWKLDDFFDSISEISVNYKACYGKDSKVIFLEQFNTEEGLVEKVYFNDGEEDIVKTRLTNIKEFSQSYLPIQPVRDPLTRRNYYVLRHRINGKDISFNSYSGAPYLLSEHIKDGSKCSNSVVVNYYVSLYALSTLCRYYPGKWNAFVRSDSSGERLLIQRLLFYSRKVLPLMALNMIRDIPVEYVATRYSPENRLKTMSEEEIINLINQEIDDKLGLSLRG